MRLSLLVRLRRRAVARLASSHGFTLVEMLATLVILGIVIGGLTDVLVSSTHDELDLNRRFTAQEQGRIALNRLRREIHCGSRLTQTGGGALASGTPYSGVAIKLGGYCFTGGDPNSTVYAGWCTRSSAPSGTYALYRVTGSSLPVDCSTGGSSVASGLTTSSPFSLPTTQPTGTLPTVHVDLSLNPDPGKSGTYHLDDDIALRNGIRS
jgi:prepilin-type N-terminal cleavage/methylation domain-containing protein